MVDAPLPIPGATQRDQRAGTGYAMALGGAALFAVNGTVSKVALTGSDLTAVDYTQIRTAGGFLGLFLALAVFARRKLRITRHDIPFFVFYGMFSFALVQWLYFVAIEHLPIGIALLIPFTGIVLVAVWARLVWHADVRPRVWAALSLTLVGLALVSEFWLGWTLDTVGVATTRGRTTSASAATKASSTATLLRSRVPPGSGTHCPSNKTRSRSTPTAASVRSTRWSLPT